MMPVRRNKVPHMPKVRIRGKARDKIPMAAIVEPLTVGYQAHRENSLNPSDIEKISQLYELFAASPAKQTTPEALRHAVQEYSDAFSQAFEIIRNIFKTKTDLLVSDSDVKITGDETAQQEFLKNVASLIHDMESKNHPLDKKALIAYLNNKLPAREVAMVASPLVPILNTTVKNLRLLTQIAGGYAAIAGVREGRVSMWTFFSALEAVGINMNKLYDLFSLYNTLVHIKPSQLTSENLVIFIGSMVAIGLAMKTFNAISQANRQGLDIGVPDSKFPRRRS